MIAVRNRALDSLHARVLHPLRHARSHHTQMLFARIEKLPDNVGAEKTSPAGDEYFLFSF